MAASTAIIGFGTLLKIGDGGGTETFTTIAEIQSIRLSGSTQQYVDITHMESPNSYREQLATFKEPGTVDVTMSYVPDNTEHMQLITDHVANTLRNFQIVLSDTSTWSFAAYIANFAWEASFDNKLSATVQLQVSGAFTVPT